MNTSASTKNPNTRRLISHRKRANTRANTRSLQCTIVHGINTSSIPWYSRIQWGKLLDTSARTPIRKNWTRGSGKGPFVLDSSWWRHKISSSVERWGWGWGWVFTYQLTKRDCRRFLFLLFPFFSFFLFIFFRTAAKKECRLNSVDLVVSFITRPVFRLSAQGAPSLTEVTKGSPLST